MPFSLVSSDLDPVRAAVAAAVTYRGSQHKLAQARGASQAAISRAKLSGRVLAGEAPCPA